MPRRKALPRLTKRGREPISYVLNTVAFGTHGDDAELETMAAKLGTTAGACVQCCEGSRHRAG